MDLMILYCVEESTLLMYSEYNLFIYHFVFLFFFF